MLVNRLTTSKLTIASMLLMSMSLVLEMKSSEFFTNELLFPINGLRIVTRYLASRLQAVSRVHNGL